jgi:hypothetical protein
MHVLPVFLLVVLLSAASATARADVQLEEFKRRIEAALAISDKSARVTALEALFHREALDDWSTKMAGRMSGRLDKLQGRMISFAPLPPGEVSLHVVDGYEYRPNLKPIGHVVFTDPAARPGNNAKVLYGRHPTQPRYAFPVVVRELVNPNAPKDKQLQMIAIGMAHPPLTFEGWCDIALSNNTVKRVTLDDQKIGNQTRIMRGQSINRCEVTNTSERGALSLRLFEDDRKLFEDRVEVPQTTIIYQKQ